MAYVFNPFTGNLDTYGPVLTGTGTVSAAADGTETLPGIAFASDLNTGIYRPGADQLALSTNGTGRLTIDGSGNINVDSGGLYYDATTNRLAIGTTGPSELIHGQSSGDAKLFLQNTSGNNTEVILQNDGQGQAGLSYNRSANTVKLYAPNVDITYVNAAQAITFNRGVNESARIDGSGRLLVGTSTSIGSDSKLQLKDGFLNVYHGNSGAGAGYGILFSTDGGATARVKAYMGLSETAGFGGNLVFSTSADGASSPTERMRITSSNFVNIGTQGTDVIWNQTAVKGITLGAVGVIQAARDADQLMLLNRITNDGALVTFAQDGVVEGDISVSGTTVSYNGAHLSRWSQLPGGAERTEILRGSVLSNIDEMCEWGEEDNEQLNRMKVSDVEGDKNVSGVFQGWDDDDDTYTNDFYCAMTGDFVIRIAQGIIVERGDLLMSAGDGTAKPQDDDIIRSKTIAKVTSTNVTCTYEDGSYCVPCVLMAC